MSNDALDEYGLPLSSLEQLQYAYTSKPTGYGPPYPMGDGLDHAEFALRMSFMDELGRRKYEQDREWAYFGAYEAYRGKVVYGPTQGPWRDCIPNSWKLQQGEL